MLTIRTSVIREGSFKEKLLKIFGFFINPSHKSSLLNKLKEKNKELYKRCAYGALDNVSYLDYKYCYDSDPDKKLTSFPYVQSEEVNVLNSKGEFVKTVMEYFFYETEFDESDGGVQVPKSKKYYLVDPEGIHYLYNFPKKYMFGGYSLNRFVKYAYIPEIGFCYVRDKHIVKLLIGNKFKYKFMAITNKWLYFIYRIRKCIENALRSIINFNYKFLHTIDSIILCIRFPFLYPRNRFTGLHYNNWKMLDKIKELRKESVVSFNVSETIEPYEIQGYLSGIEVQKKLDDEYEKMFDGIRHDDQYVYYFIDGDGNEIPVMRTYKNIKYRFKILDKNEQPRMLVWTEINGGIWIDITDEKPLFKSKDGEPKESSYYRVVINKKLSRKADRIEWFHKYVLNTIFSIPKYNELDAMEEGWRRRFGMDMMKELRKQLSKENYLYKFRITQIKEKFGGLRFYVECASKEVYSIIDKYGSMSFGICINCGKDAKYKTTGWVLPYCEECIKEHNAGSYVPIDEDEPECDEEDGE